VRLIEPLGLLDGAAALDATRAGLALPLAGGPLGFTLVRLIEDRGNPRPVPVGAIPADWAPALERVTRPRPAWAALDLDRPAVMGILNVTPDSFSDGGAYGDPASAVAAGRAMAAAGADIVDVGGESTRPGASAVPPEMEQARVLPVIRGLAARGLRVSIDTRNAATMRAALDAGAAIVNDISGLSHDAAAAPLLAARGCPVVLMHMRGEPATMHTHASYDDVAIAVTGELASRVAAAERAGIASEQIVIDPGIGFAKTATHNLELLSRLPLLLNLGCRVLVGVSRKAFIGKLSGAIQADDRDAGSLAAGLYSVARSASILRVHDVAGTVQALRVWRALTAGPFGMLGSPGAAR
jgi:dihydropteroate synthase